MSLPRQGEIHLDASAVLFTFAVSIITGLLCGLAPARSVFRFDVNPVLRGSGRGASEGRRQKCTRQMLVVAEVALALVLLVGAGLMVRSFAQLRAVDPGFDPKNLVAFTVSPAPTAGSDFYGRLQRHLETLPGVQSASLINHLPVNGDMWSLTLHIAGRPAPPPGHEDSAVYRVVRPRYFETMRIGLRQGRDFAETDSAESPGVAIINEAAARHYWPGENPLNARIQFGGGENWLTVVGVAADATQHDWTARPSDEIYLPQAQATGQGPARAMTVVARLAASNLAEAAASAGRAVDRDMPVSQPQLMEQIIADQLWQNRLSMLLFGAFSAIALILAAVGIYGIVSYSVSQRLREFGIRMALGAGRTRLLAGVLGEGLRMIGIGLLLGVGASVLLARTLSGLLYEVRPTDPLTFAAVPILLLLAGITATWLPALRATNVDPASSLRGD